MKRFSLTAIFLIAVLECSSNNITISNVNLVGKNTVANYVLIQFDISWDNSWRTSSGPSNWDAAWVFVKFRVKGEANWGHVALNWVDGTGTGDGHTVPAGAIIKGANDISNKSRGVFIYASSDKPQSTATYTGVQLRWPYTFNGVADNDVLEICVFAIEMVYVPEGQFQLGGYGIGNIFTNHFFSQPTLTSPYTVQNEDPITVGNNNGNLMYTGQGDQLGPIPAEFPKGFSAFYCMKYEITQEQYVEFLLKLTLTQANTRVYVGGGNRHAITGAYGSYSTNRPYVACNWLSAADLLAYLAWAALRPMTELEFEKACRPAVTAESAWGSSTWASQPYGIASSGLETEIIVSNYNQLLGNVNHSSTSSVEDGPLRVGIFAAHPDNNGRVTAGATYYGIMEMSGNVNEQVVSAGRLEGRAFTGNHGQGNTSLDVSGYHTVAGWPLSGNGLGSGLRGGSWQSISGGPGDATAIAARPSAATAASLRAPGNGGRGVRTAP